MSKIKKNLEISADGRLSQITSTQPADTQPDMSENKEPKDCVIPDLRENKLRAKRIHRLIGPLHGFIRMLYKNQRNSGKALNKVFNRNIQTAIKGIHPKLSVDFSQLMLSVGTLPQALQISVCSPNPGKLVFSWVDNSGMAKAHATDQVFVAVYCKDVNIWIANPYAAERKDGYCVFGVDEFQGKAVETYLGFVSEELSRTSNSIYAGHVTIY